MMNNTFRKLKFILLCLSILSITHCSGQKTLYNRENMNEALIVIDCQEGFFSDPNYLVYNEAKLIQNINALIDHFRKNNKPIIFVRHIDEDLIKGTGPWKVYSKIHSKPDDIYIDKTTPDSFLETDLLSILKSKKIDSIVIAGLQTDYCIDTTCRSAFGKNIPAILVSDAHSTYDNSFMKADKIIEYHNKIIGRWFAKLKTTEEISINYR
ncbi:MAG: cysteine hydrolase [Salinivirgaceae bacterium]|nr:cysteine hydrolase [Salinivirgaceae bacterium]